MYRITNNTIVLLPRVRAGNFKMNNFKMYNIYSWYSDKKSLRTVDLDA